MIDLFKTFLTNKIIVDWVAPIITGLIVFAITTFIIKFFQIRKDKKKVNDANRRYLDSVRPYIIQKIEISSKLISDLRKVVVNESELKNKFVYSELQLRNKMIMDITESKYIDEVNKYELIDFTYATFKDFEKSDDDSIVVKNNPIKKFKLNNNIIFIVSLIILTIVSLFDKDGSKNMDNPAALLSTIVCLFYILIFLSNIVFKLFKSEVSESKSYDYYSEYYEILKQIWELKEEKNKKTQKTGK